MTTDHIAVSFHKYRTQIMWKYYQSMLEQRRLGKL